LSKNGYGQYCPISMTAELLCTRWTMLIVRELLNGSTRFNELRRGLARMSPALLSRRLKELEMTGIVDRKRLRGGGDLYEYKLTEAGGALGEVVKAFAVWGQTWVEEQATLDNASIDHLMWELQQHARPGKVPKIPSVVNFLFEEQPKSKSRWWLLFESLEKAEVCHDDPGREVDLYVATDVVTLTAIWLGITDAKRAITKGSLVLTGDRQLAGSMQGWLGLSPVASLAKRGGVRLLDER
jgi:DNA-binding HxlR family transcriptional regulator